MKNGNKFKSLLNIEKFKGFISELIYFLFVYLLGFYGISTFGGYLMQNPFLYKQFYFKQFSLA